jgi:tetratricopeptide (TPR) repeat protein
LTETIGDYSQSLPEIVIRKEKRFGASYRRSENTIFIEQSAIDICASFGPHAKDALAFLLGHELTHYYQKHDWKERGFTSFIAPKLIYREHIHHEKEADTYAAFIAHLAGYNCIQIIPDLLDKIYLEYDLKGKKLNTYPSLEERKKTGKEICKMVQNLIDIYEMGNYMFALGKFEEALVSYEYLEKYVRFKELYNNIGLGALYAAISVANHKNAFLYPLTLDPSTPLRAPSNITREDLMKKAINAFAKATNYDANYFTSFLNLICAYDVDGQTKQAMTLLNQLKRLTNTTVEKDKLLLLEGILAFRKGQNALARAHFSTIKNNNISKDLVFIATHNLKILEGTVVDVSVSVAYNPMGQDKIDNTSLLFYQPNDDIFKFLLKDTPLDKKWLSIEADPAFKIYVFSSNQKVTKLQITDKPTFKTKKAIGINASFAEIKQQYPNAKFKITPQLKGYFLILPTQGLLFNMNASNKVKSWGIFVD